MFTAISRAMCAAALAFAAFAAATASAQSSIWARKIHADKHGALVPASGDMRRGPRSMVMAPNGDIVVTGTNFRTAKFSGVTGEAIWVAVPPVRGGKAYGVALTPAGDVLVTGVVSGFDANNYRSDNYRTIKFSGATGAVIWEKEHDSSPQSTTPSDRANAVASDAAGNAIVTGLASNELGKSDLVTIKYAAADGAVLWQRSYGNLMQRKDSGWAVTVDANGNSIVAGRSHNGSSYEHVVLKYSPSGDTLWTRTIPAAIWLEDAPMLVSVDAQNNAILGTNISSAGSDIDMLTMKLAAASGNVLWSRITGGQYQDGLNGMTVDAGGNVVVTGFTPGASPFDTQMTTIKYAAVDGNIVWQKNYSNGPIFPFAGTAVATDSTGNVIASGTTNGGGQTVTIKYAAATGTVLWTSLITGESSGFVFAVGVDGNGNAIAAGSSANSMKSPDLRLFKFASLNGAQLWQRGQVDITVAAATQPSSALALDSAGNAVIAGRAQTMESVGTYEYPVVGKYAAAGGAPIWERKFAGPAPRLAGFVAVTVDGTDNVVAGGFENPEVIGGPSLLLLGKYAGGDGAVLWERTLDVGQVPYFAVPQGIVANSAGDLFVAVTVTDAFTVLKIDGSTGNVIWEKSMATPQYPYASLQRFVLDAAGNLLMVSARKADYYGGMDARVSKLSGATGATLWDQAFSNPGQKSSGGASLAVDAAGDAVVTGSTTTPSDRLDFMTVKYAGATGQVIWTQTFASVGAHTPWRDGRGIDIALDAAGNAVVVGNGGYYGFAVALKYRASDGAELWRYNPNTEEDVAMVEGDRVLIDSAGHVIVGAATMKLNGATGDRLWLWPLGVSNGKAVALRGDAAYRFGEARLYPDTSIDSVFVYGLEKVENPADDTTPEPFAFSMQYSIPSALLTSNAVATRGYLSPAPISVANGEYSIGCSGTFTSAPGLISPHQQVCVRHTSAETIGQSVTTTLTIGGFSTSFVSTTSMLPLTVSLAGNGSGSVSAGSGPVCPPSCTFTYSSGTTVGLSATPAAGSRFVGWSGCDSIVLGDCRIDLVAARTVTANFELLAARASDFSGDGRSDLLWYNTATGMLYQLQMNGMTLGPSAVIDQETDLNWKVVAIGDLNGDGRADIVWQHGTTGQVYGLLMNGTSVAGEGTIYTEPNTNWKIVGAGDFNGDSRADLLWKNNATGDVFLLLLNGLTVTSGGVIYSEPNPAWQIQKVADFNGDGRADVLWRNTATGDVYMMLMNGTTVTGGGVIYSEPNTAWQIQAAADFNGDGRADVLWRNTATGDVYMMLLNGTTITGGSVFYGEPNADWKIVATGDYNGDGRADILWRNTATGQVFMMLMNGFTISSGDFVYTEPDQNWRILGP